MVNDDNSSTDGELNQNLITKDLTMRDLSRFIELVFPSRREAGYRAGLSETRVNQILIGYNLPVKASTIYRISKAWHIDALKLSILFQNSRRKQKEDCPDIVPANEYSPNTQGENSQDNNPANSSHLTEEGDGNENRA